MDFGLSTDQELLATSARDFLAVESSPEIVRRLSGDPLGLSPELNRKIVAQGWPGILIPESYGGLGLGLLDAAVLLTELGRALTPAPILSSAILATSLIVSAGTSAQKKRWLPKLTAGEILATVAWFEESDRLDPAGISLRPRRAREQLRLSGAKLFVLDAHVADLLLVAIRSGAGTGESGISVLVVPRDTDGVTVTPLETVDRTRRVFEVTFDDVVVPREQILGSEGKAWRHLARLLDVASVAIAAECQGGAERALAMAVDYSRVREQFGRPIGSFQALKHIAAECVAEIEPARSLLWYAACAADSIPRDASVSASMAKSRLAEVYSRTANRAVQMHGGIGFTWEHDVHFWYKRARCNEAFFGSPAFHRERIARLSGW